MKRKKKSEMELNIIAVLVGITSKIAAILSTTWGWVVLTVGTILTFFIPLKVLFIVLGAIIIGDLVFGIWAAIKKGEHITSSKLRSTLIKSLVYLTVIPAAYAVEAIIGWAIAYKVLFAIAAGTEIYSMIANLLIIKPDMPFLRLFKGLVSGEIAKKVGLTQDKVEDLLKGGPNDSETNI